MLPTFTSFQSIHNSGISFSSSPFLSDALVHLCLLKDILCARKTKITKNSCFSSCSVLRLLPPSLKVADVLFSYTCISCFLLVSLILPCFLSNCVPLPGGILILLTHHPSPILRSLTAKTKKELTCMYRKRLAKHWISPRRKMDGHLRL